VTTTGGRAWYETAFGAHYPLLYSHRDLAEAGRCLDLLSRLAPLGEGPVLDLGCGQGRHLGLLERRGVRALGVDLSRALLVAARRAAPALGLVQADMRRLPLRDGSCSAALSLFTAFGYFGPADAHLPVAREVARVLSPGGHWYLDYLDSARVAAELASGVDERERTVAALQVREQRRLAERPRRVIKSVELTPRPGREAEARALGIGRDGLRYVEEVTLLGLDELDRLANAAGLVRAAAAGGYDGRPLVPGVSERWLLVYRRPDDAGGKA